MEHLDVVIVGAGLSGIGMAWHLQDRLPGKRYAILEAREASGGTWDLFRYPGIRSDSDMHTLGYRFKPWTGAKALADGASILAYVRETAAEPGIDAHIRYGHRVVRAEWSTPDARWTVARRRADTGEPLELTRSFLLGCSGYYRYDEGYTPPFEGRERLRAARSCTRSSGREDLDYAGKRVVVIGSGATAVTLVPALAEHGRAHVTMLQRSPTYVLSMPERGPDRQRAAQRLLGDRARATRLTRWKNVVARSRRSSSSAGASRDPMRRLSARARSASCRAGYDVDTHFNPRYEPWDQRLCLVPDGDLLRGDPHRRRRRSSPPRSSTFTEPAIRLRVGAELEADIDHHRHRPEPAARSAGCELAVDGATVDARRDTMAYKAMMLSDVPNFAFAIGYTNASWTLKADLVARVRRAGCSTTWTPTACAARCPSATRRRRAPVHGLRARLRAARARPAAARASERPWRLSIELHHRRRRDPPRRGSTTACCSSPDSLGSGAI